MKKRKLSSAFLLFWLTVLTALVLVAFLIHFIFASPSDGSSNMPLLLFLIGALTIEIILLIEKSSQSDREELRILKQNLEELKTIFGETIANHSKEKKLMEEIIRDLIKTLLKQQKTK